jgi:phosphoribosylformimino-5-aminoimidazole carboxamide ribotide isomerase
VNVYPAIDLLGGRVARLRQGDYARATHYPVDPLELARAYRGDGARWLHLVDLDAARSGTPVQFDLIGKLAAIDGLRLQVGGGVRDEAALAALLAAGASRVVVGSIAVRDPERTIEWLGRHGSERICLALDVRAGADGSFRPSAGAWTEAGDVTVDALIERYAAAAPLRHVLCTDIVRDGMLAGPNVALYRALAARHAGIAFQASGGVRHAADVAALRAAGAMGAIVGVALLEGRVSLAELVAC